MEKEKSSTIIKIAILAEEPFFWCSRKHYHKLILDGYTWKINESTYTFQTSYLYDKDIIDGKLTPSRYDVLLIPGGGVGNNEALLKGLDFFWNVRKFKRNLGEFVKNGGGIMGICGGAALITDIKLGDNRKPTSITERLYQKSSLGISAVSSQFKAVSFPLFYPLQYPHPEGIGNSAYAFSFAAGETIDGKHIMTTGCPLDIQINHDNPIFSDYDKNIRRMRWWAAQSLHIKEHSGRKVNIIARYPASDVSDHQQTRIHYWRYTGGLIGLFQAFLKAVTLKKQHHLNWRLLSLFTFYLAGDWEPTEKIVELDMTNQPCITTEIYPNRNKGRIVLNMLHAEYLIWWGGHIVEQPSDEFNCLGKGLHQWKDINTLSDNLEKELPYNWWILRRLIAWAAKIPDTDLPPIQKGIITDEMKEIILPNLFWDGSLFHQLKNI